MLRLYVLIVLIMLSFLELSAQFGIRVSAAQNDYQSWDQVTLSSALQNDENIFKSTYEIGFDYWFRLKNVRIEFYPEVSYRFTTSDKVQLIDNNLPSGYKLRSVGIGVNTHIYPFDLINDCDCPTFSKQNDFFKKGFFVMVGINEYYQQKKYSNLPEQFSDFTMAISGGLGVDIGINDLLTISPFISAAYFPSTEWEGISTAHGIINVAPPDETTSNLAFEVGFRLGFRPDYLNKR